MHIMVIRFLKYISNDYLFKDKVYGKYMPVSC